MTAPEDDPPSRYTNLQFLPDDITKDELIQTMKFITRSLGTKCKFCHRSDIRDYASDELEKKVIARRMMQMVERLNRELFADRGAPRVTCFMCHRGQLKPPMRP